MLRESLYTSLVFISAITALPASNIERSTGGGSSESTGYAPVRVQCPARDQWIRPAIGLSDEETAWVAGRKEKVLKGLTSYLGRLNLEGFDTEGYLKKLSADTSNVPTIGMAISGGGWSSAMTGTGPLLAWDDRFEPSCEHRTGGILQSMTYLSGLSGGSWPVMSLATYNFPTIPEMVANWHTDQLPLPSVNLSHRFSTAELFKQIVPKFQAGFNVSVSELLGRGFAQEYVAGANGGLETTLSGVTSLSNFQNHEMPLPMWQAPRATADDIKLFGLKVPYFNATFFEWTPFEFGAWRGPKAFFPTKYLGTTMKDGKPADDKCVVGFDRASYMLGAAADAMNFWQIEAWSNGTLAHFGKRSSTEDDATQNVAFPEAMLKELEDPFKEYFNYTLPEMMYTSLPNPFAASSPTDDNNAASLELLDESEARQALPLWEQIQPAREPEFIISWDANQDAQPYAWNNGSNLHETYIYATSHGVPFPLVPKPATFINRGYTAKPVFFGCDANLTNMKDTRSPIIASMMNAPYSAFTNYTWTRSEFSNEQMSVILTNGFNYATAGNSTLDSEWPECLGCAAIDRSLTKIGMGRTAQCQRCMIKYCWDGVEDDGPSPLVDLPLALDKSVSYAEWNKSATTDYWPELGPNGLS